MRWEDGWNILQKMSICNSHFLMGAMTDLLFGVNIDKRSLSTLQDITSNGRFDSVKIMTVNLPVYVFFSL